MSKQSNTAAQLIYVSKHSCSSVSFVSGIYNWFILLLLPCEIANAPTQCPQMLSSFLFPSSFLWLVTKLGLIYSKPIAHKVRGDSVISKLLKTFTYILFPGQKAFIKKSLNFKLTRDSSSFSY